MKIIMELLFLAVGFAMLVKGADWFVEGSSGIADRFGVPQLVIGLTIVAMGTSAPEAAVSITAALKGNAEITIGNIVGSNILNILIILGVTSAIRTLAVAKSTVRVEIPYMIFITVVLLFAGISQGVVSRGEGVLLWILFLIYLGYLLYMAMSGRTETVEEQEAVPLWRMAVSAGIGLFLVVAGSDVTVDAASGIAELMGMSERFIGLTIVALGTSLPELFTSVSAALKGKADIAIGNIVGSNIFNVLFVVGTTAIITPVPFQPGFRIDTLVAAGAALLLFLSVLRRQKLTRGAGILMLASYAGYFIWLML